MEVLGRERRQQRKNLGQDLERAWAPGLFEGKGECCCPKEWIVQRPLRGQGCVFGLGFREQVCQARAEVSRVEIGIMGLPSLYTEVRNCDCRLTSQVGNGTNCLLIRWKRSSIYLLNLSEFLWIVLLSFCLPFDLNEWPRPQNMRPEGIP